MKPLISELLPPPLGTVTGGEKWRRRTITKATKGCSSTDPPSYRSGLVFITFQHSFYILIGSLKNSERNVGILFSRAKKIPLPGGGVVGSEQ